VVVNSATLIIKGESSMKQEMLTIKAKNKKLGGFSRVVGEVEFSQMIDKDDYEVVVKESSKPKPKAKPKVKPKAKKSKK
tara:strand:- start:66 stop:302 length:237 start_codon:yes stop_codon:yes gene_type:complete